MIPSQMARLSTKTDACEALFDDVAYYGELHGGHDAYVDDSVPVTCSGRSEPDPSVV
jgi:hypothetical protein